jgi:hypothetical protein
VDRLCRLKLDLEADVEDASNGFYNFQIQRSIIYLKFGGCTIGVFRVDKTQTKHKQN